MIGPSHPGHVEVPPDPEPSRARHRELPVCRWERCGPDESPTEAAPCGCPHPAKGIPTRSRRLLQREGLPDGAHNCATQESPEPVHKRRFEGPYRQSSPENRSHADCRVIPSDSPIGGCFSVDVRNPGLEDDDEVWARTERPMVSMT